MTLTNDHLESERPHDPFIGGVIRLYRYGPRFQLSLIDGAMAHSFPFAWEAAVLVDGCLCYETPLTDDVEVFRTDEEANAFLDKAKTWFASPEAAGFPDNSQADAKRILRMRELAKTLKAEEFPK